MNPTTNETVSFHPQPEATENQVSAIKILFLNSRNDLWIATENALIVYDYQGKAVWHICLIQKKLKNNRHL